MDHRITGHVGHTPTSALAAEKLTDLSFHVAWEASEIAPRMQWAAVVLCLSGRGAFFSFPNMKGM